MKQSNSNKSLIYGISAVLLWSTVATAFKIALNEINLFMVLWIASVSASLILFVFYIFEKEKDPIKINDWLRSSINGLFNPFVYYLVLFKAYDLLPAQVAQPLNYTWPIVLTILSALIFKLKVHWNTWLGLLLSFGGVMLISNPFGNVQFNWLGVSLAVGSSLIWSTYWLLNYKDHRKESSKLMLNFLMGSIYISLLLLFEPSNFHFTFKGLVSSIYIGWFEMGITFFLWMKALKLSEHPGKIANIVFLSPFISFIFIAIILKEDIHWYTIVGLLTIILGIVAQKVFSKTKAKL
ncbi:MAG: DMT family transporter [Bacteroidales bacterium]|nr:DMT family transporter [Bacteroidales bacterium]